MLGLHLPIPENRYTPGRSNTTAHILSMSTQLLVCYLKTLPRNKSTKEGLKTMVYKVTEEVTVEVILEAVV